MDGISPLDGALFGYHNQSLKTPGIAGAAAAATAGRASASGGFAAALDTAQTAASRAAAHSTSKASAAKQVQGIGARIAPDTKIDKTSDLYKQCQEFESIFVKMMITQMQKTVDKSSDILSGGYAEEVFQDMLNDEYSQSMTKTANFGIADQLYRQLSLLA